MAVAEQEKKTPTDKVTKKKVSAKRRGRPPKGAAVTKKKTSKKKVAARAKTVATETQTTARRGRPVSVEALQKKLDSAQAALQKEKDRRVTQVAGLQQKLAVAIANRKELQQKVTELSRSLATIEAEKKNAEREQQRVEKKEAAKQAALEKFLESWEKRYQAAESKKGTGRKKRGGKGRGRPRKSAE